MKLSSDIREAALLKIFFLTEIDFQTLETKRSKELSKEFFYLIFYPLLDLNEND